MEGIGESTSAGEASTGAERKAAIERFARIFYDESAETWQTVRWGGVPVYKLPLDLWVMSEIIFETRPALIIETGVAEGGSTLFFANLLDLLGAGRVLSVDTDLSPVDEAVRAHPRVTLIEGSSTDPDTVARLRASAQGTRTMVVLDSDHSAVHVTAELAELAELVSPGCYLVVEDTNINGHPVNPGFGAGPAEALATWLEHDPPFDVDRTRERLLVTHNPGGWLRRRGDLPEDEKAPPPGRGPGAGRNGDGEPAAAELLRKLHEAEREREELRALAGEADAARQEAGALEVRIGELEPEVESVRAALRRGNEKIAELRAELLEQAKTLEDERRKAAWRDREIAEQRRAAEAKLAETRAELEALRMRYESIRSSVPMRAYDRIRALPPFSLISERRARRHRLAWQEQERRRLDEETDGPQ